MPALDPTAMEPDQKPAGPDSSPADAQGADYNSDEVFRFSWKMTVLKIRYTHEKRSCHEQTTPSSSVVRRRCCGRHVPSVSFSVVKT